MEGASPDSWRGRAALACGHGDRDPVVAEAALQLDGRFAGEGADHGVIGIGRSVPDPAGHTEGEDAGLARSGPSHDAQCV